MTSKKRFDEIDIIKAISIILMVVGHSGFTNMKFISLFHVAVFIIASGFFYKNSYTNNLKSTILAVKNKLKQLLLPYAFYNALFTIFNNVFLKIGIYTDNLDIYNYIDKENIVISHYMSFNEMFLNIVKGFIFAGGTALGGAMWFLKVLCTISLLYIFIDYLIKIITKNSKTIFYQGVVSIFLLSIGYYCSLKNMELIILARVFSFYSLYYLGVLISNKSNIKNLSKDQYTYILILSFISLILLSNIGTIALNANQYTNPIFLLLSSTSGWYFLYCIAYFIKQTRIKTFFTFIGKRTLIILCLHILAMKPCAYIVALNYNLPLYCVSSHPNLFGNHKCWFIAYTIFGIVVPALISLIKEKAKQLSSNTI